LDRRKPYNLTHKTHCRKTYAGASVEWQEWRQRRNCWFIMMGDEIREIEWIYIKTIKNS
jgi:hypothetical protein